MSIDNIIFCCFFFIGLSNFMIIVHSNTNIYCIVADDFNRIASIFKRTLHGKNIINLVLAIRTDN